MAKSFLKEKFIGIPVWFLLILVVLIAGIYGYENGWFDKDPVVDNTSKLKLGMEFDHVAANGNNGAGHIAERYNYDVDDGTVRVHVNTRKISNSTHTNFTMFAQGNDFLARQDTSQPGVLSAPTQPVTLGVGALVCLEYLSGCTNTMEILTSSVSVSAPLMKDANGSAFSPVAKIGNKPGIYVGGVLDKKDIDWTYSDTFKDVGVQFELDWEGVDKMNDGDELKIPVKITNIDGKGLTIVLVKDSSVGPY